MKPIHKFILVGFMALSVGTFIFGVLQLGWPTCKGRTRNRARTRGVH